MILFQEYSNRAINTLNAKQVSGLQLHYDFLSKADETNLIKIIDQSPWILDLKRRVQHYGYKYDYKSRKIDLGFYIAPLPSWLDKY